MWYLYIRHNKPHIQDIKHRCVCYSMHALIIHQSPKLASLRQWAWWWKLSLHLITQYSRVFLSGYGAYSVCVWNITLDTDKHMAGRPEQRSAELTANYVYTFSQQWSREWDFVGSGFHQYLKALCKCLLRLYVYSILCIIDIQSRKRSPCLFTDPKRTERRSTSRGRCIRDSNLWRVKIICICGDPRM